MRAEYGAGHRRILFVSPTGSGKTVTFAHILTETPGMSISGKMSVGTAAMAVPPRNRTSAART